MRKLLIISASLRMLKEPMQPIRAADRFDGILMRTTRKYIPKLKRVDILILSPVHGLISPEDKIPYNEPIGESWNKVQFSRDKIQAAKKTNLGIISQLLSGRKYVEIYINVGKTMQQLMEGFEQIVPKTTKIIFAQGRGIGPKVAHMKKWLELQLH